MKGREKYIEMMDNDRMVGVKTEPHLEKITWKTSEKVETEFFFVVVGIMRIDKQDNVLVVWKQMKKKMKRFKLLLGFKNAKVN